MLRSTFLSNIPIFVLLLLGTRERGGAKVDGEQRERASLARAAAILKGRAPIGSLPRTSLRVAATASLIGGERGVGRGKQRSPS